MKFVFFFQLSDNHVKNLYLDSNYFINSSLYTSLLLQKIDYISKLLINILNK